MLCKIPEILFMNNIAIFQNDDPIRVIGFENFNQGRFPVIIFNRQIV